jgi:hypothetical protein
VTKASLSLIRKNAKRTGFRETVLPRLQLSKELVKEILAFCR